MNVPIQVVSANTINIVLGTSLNTFLISLENNVGAGYNPNGITLNVPAQDLSEMQY